MYYLLAARTEVLRVVANGKTVEVFEDVVGEAGAEAGAEGMTTEAGTTVEMIGTAIAAEVDMMTIMAGVAGVVADMADMAETGTTVEAVVDTGTRQDHREDMATGQVIQLVAMDNLLLLQLFPQLVIVRLLILFPR